LSAGYGPVIIGYAIGEMKRIVGEVKDYDFPRRSVDLGAGFYGTYGVFGDDATVITLSRVRHYGSEIDLGVALIFPDDRIGE
jgi:hypothetical protein